MSNPTAALLELRQHYQSIVAQAQQQIAEATAQLKEIDAKMLSELVQGQASPTLTSAPVALTSAPTPAPATASAADASQPESSQGDRTPRSLQSAYEGLTRFDAITKALQTTAGHEMTTDSLITELFGELSESEQKAEGKRLYTLLYNGEKKGLWQKGKAPRSYLVSPAKATKSNHQTTKASKEVAPTASTSKPQSPSTKSSNSRGSLELLPEFEGVSKLTAITQVLSEQPGQVLHQDTILDKLYGDLNPEVAKSETKKLRASLFQGVSRGLWQRAPKQPSSYLVKASKSRKAKDTTKSSSIAPVQAEVNATEKAPSTKNPGRPSGSTNKSKPVQAASKATSAKGSRGREQVLSLPSEFDGLSKIEAVEKVLGEHPDTVVSITDIVERLYGKLTGADLRAEKDRMKDVITRGIKRGLWNRAEGVPSSYVVKA